jgi:GAF domain-containing protein
MTGRHDALETAKLLSSALTFADLSRVVLKIVRDEIGFDRGTIFVVDSQAQQVRSIVADRMLVGEIAVPIGSGIAGTVAQTGRMVDTVDAYADDRFDAKFDPILGYETRDIYCIPIKNRRGDVVGVLQLLNRSRSLESDDKTFLADMSTHLATALERISAQKNSV